ncbi:hypothetical protein ACJVC5_08630 [Peredibacter sp. HCB2-198]|uniref:hypothetical protein n=1 Tax=Peredibacter sp. HCB2-198 TaxID=3383025 RepID=UPI0038B6A8E8
MKKFWLVLLLILSFPLLAREPRHMITFGSQGLGWLGSAEKMETRSSSPFKSVDYFLSNLAINYAYRLYPRFQIGAFYEGVHTEYKFHRRGGSTSSQETEINTLGIFLLYNFHDDIHNAYYIGASASNNSRAEEISHDFTDAEGKAPIELDDTNQIYELLFGKRIPVVMMGFENLSFSPQVRAFYKTHGKDFNDQDVKYGLGFTIIPVRFDLLF